MPSIAVFLAAYNGSAWLREQVDSILAQEGVLVTVFVSVDRSSDGTERLVDEIAAKDPRIVVLPHGRCFGGAAANFFRLIRELDYSRFEYVSFSDQDDVWSFDKLKRAHETLLRTGSDAYSSNVLAFWPCGRKRLIEKSQAQVRWDFLFEAAGPGCTYVMRKELASALGDLLKTCWRDVQQVGLHDWLAYAFARANGYRWVIDDYPGMLYRQHDSNQVGVNSGVMAFAHRASKVLNGWGLAQSALIAQLVGMGDDPFVRRWAGGGRIGLLWLGFHAWQCRRRARDKMIFFLSCVALCFVGVRRE